MMKQRGRKSAGELAMVVPPVREERPEPPVELTPEQADVWNSITAVREAGWFTGDVYPVLMQYCRHTVEARRLAQLIDQECAKGEMDLKVYLTLLKQQNRETASIAAAATKMRITQQASRTERAAAKKTLTVRRPWQSD